MFILGHVTFITRKRQHEAALVVAGILDHLIDPVLHRCKTSLISQVIANYRANGISVVKGDHGSKLFGTTRIPQMQLNLLLRESFIIGLVNPCRHY